MTIGRRGSLRIAFGVVIVVLVALAVVSGVRNRSLRMRMSGLESMHVRLYKQSEALAAEAGTLHGRLEALGKALPNAPAHTAPKENLTEEADLLRRISDLEASLKTAGSSLSDLQLRSRQLEEKIADTGAETAKLTDKQADLRKRLSDAESVVQAMESELRGKQSRLVPLELSARDLHSSRQAALDSIDRLVGPARAIEEIERRRETYLGSLLSRYRQLVDQSRFQSLQPATPVGANPATSLDLSRVQSMVSQAEEDQRQIQALDAQAQLVLDRMQKTR